MSRGDFLVYFVFIYERVPMTKHMKSPHRILHAVRPSLDHSGLRARTVPLAIWCASYQSSDGPPQGPKEGTLSKYPV